MPAIVQVSIVLIALGVMAAVGSVLVAFASLRRLNENLLRVTNSMESVLQRLDRLADSSQAIADSVHEVIQPLRRASESLGLAGERAASLSTEVMDRIELPVRSATNVGRGLGAGIAFLAKRLAKRWQEERGGHDEDDEREERDERDDRPRSRRPHNRLR